MLPNFSQLTLILAFAALLCPSGVPVKGQSLEKRRQTFYGQAEVNKAGQKSSLMDAFSLSFVGDFDFTLVLDGLKKILDGVATCECCCSKVVFFLGGGGVSDPLCLSSSSAFHFVPIILFLSTTL
jgi:hypothetical protein